jgi:hypothetical protein
MGYEARSFLSFEPMVNFARGTFTVPADCKATPAGASVNLTFPPMVSAIDEFWLMMQRRAVTPTQPRQVREA